jgi:hypothetical protein
MSLMYGSYTCLNEKQPVCLQRSGDYVTEKRLLERVHLVVVSSGLMRSSGGDRDREMFYLTTLTIAKFI